MKMFTRQEVYNACMAAASLIEHHSERYNFQDSHVPRNTGCGTTGCLWGWIGYFLGIRPGTSISYVADACGAHDTGDLYAFRRDLFNLYTGSPDVAVAKLRMFAEANFGHAAAPPLDPAFVAFKSSLEGINA